MPTSDAAKASKILFAKAIEVTKLLDSWYADMRIQLAPYETPDRPLSPTLQELHVPSDRDMALILLANIYYTAYLLTHSTIAFTVSRCSDVLLEADLLISDSALNERVWSQLLHELDAEPVILSFINKTSSQILEDAKIHAKKISRSIHLMHTSESGMCHYAISAYPLAFALLFLTMLEPPDEPSQERRRLSRLWNKPTIGSTVGRFSEIVSQKLVYPGMPEEYNLCGKGADVLARVWWCEGLAKYEVPYEST
ncbi:hypothetical protein VHEMI00838 [[Torrubiella] hemipterigena]|uniref:Transcription factor domain-containing protein n=1 Tax=[Torrubiella] hemipterigena TaxID=1531966 RepID=A0A0A1T352_9HYPO|nr:hypothetical protein VHEMI00838 [[Torrubiella] hemipterigena]